MKAKGSSVVESVFICAEQVSIILMFYDIFMLIPHFSFISK